MITRIEAKNFRCLRYVSQPLENFHVLVGPNASGKTTFLDVIGFLGRMVADGLEAAVNERTSNFVDLLWQRSGHAFELALEAVIPQTTRKQLAKPFGAFRYEIRIGLDPETREVGILDEKAWVQQAESTPKALEQRKLFPMEPIIPDTLLTSHGKQWQKVLSKTYRGNDNFYMEVRETGDGKGWFPSLRLGPRKSALANVPEDEATFPVATWFKRTLMEGVQQIALNSMRLRRPSPPNRGIGFSPDGSNLPWVVWNLEQPANRKRFTEWVEHVRTALPDIENIETVERPEDRHRYLVLHCHGGLKVPSWMASDGTLRLLALTIPAYIPDFKGICLIEEPENGIHPQAVETVFQSLSSVYEAQVLLATHSPVILSVAEADKVLCFKKTDSGATDIVRGDAHPALRNWRGGINLGDLFAAGVLG
ncbi:MAG: AAA family ATPase [Lentisphaerae bacterium]|nr:AAA family ATPase [Lentisphaerota bacterium]